MTVLAARLGIILGPDEQQTKEKLLSAIRRELKDLQVPEPNEEQKARQVVLMKAHEELMENGNTTALPSTDLVPISLVSQIIQSIQTSAAQQPTIASARVDPTSVMRTTVKPTATQASSDFTKKRIIPFSVAGGLIVTAYGFRTYFGEKIGEIRLPSDLFYPFIWTTAVAIVIGYGIFWVGQTSSNRVLRALYSPDVQEAALESHLSDTADYFGQHGNREFGIDRLEDEGKLEWAVAHDDNSFIISRAMYRVTLRDLAYGRGSLVNRAMTLLSTIDLDAATDDATGLALDRLVDLEIIESVVYRRRQGFRVIPLG